MSSGDPATDGIDFDRDAAPEEVLAEFGTESPDDVAENVERAATDAEPDASAFEEFTTGVAVRPVEEADADEGVPEELPPDGLFGD